MRSMCLCTLLVGVLLARPALAQQANTQTSSPVQIARTTDDLRERILMDRIDELEKRLAELEERTSSEQPVAVAAAETSAAVPAAPAAPASPQDADAPWSIGPVQFSGVVDGYYSFNSNHPFDRMNSLYNFNTAANQFDLSFAKITLSHDADPVGFTIDFGYGKTMQIVNSFDNDGGFNQYLEQAFVSWKPDALHGIQMDFGKFVTSAGAELIESYPNWNYSRSILFAYTIPFYHFGFRGSVPVGPHFTAGVQVVNGWNNVVDNNSGKTVGLTGALSFDKVQWFVNYYGGPENSNTNTGWRNLIDTTVVLAPTSTISAYINYDYGQDRDPFGFLSRWQGIATALHYQASPRWAFSGRGEWFRDYQGFSTGQVQTLNEVTFTGEYKIMKGLLWRAEYRRDWSDIPFFTRGDLPFDVMNQNTATIGFVGFFGGPQN